jgi:hypothetical protein
LWRGNLQVVDSLASAGAPFMAPYVSQNSWLSSHSVVRAGYVLDGTGRLLG